MSLVQLSERRSESLVRRFARCECGPDCETRVLLATVPGAHEELWVAIAVGGVVEVAAANARLLAEAEAPARLEVALALGGLPWEVVSLSEGVAASHLAAIDALPDWMHRMPRGFLWETRRWVFGSDVGRVPRALWALNRCYSPDALGPNPAFDQDWSWGVQFAEGPALEPWGR